MTVYVMCPAGVVGSAPESLHQLAHHARAQGYDAQIYFYGEQRPRAREYRDYDVAVADSVLDTEESIIVVPEVEPEFFRAVKRARRVMWWLSVDRFSYVNKIKADQDGTAYGRLPLDFVYDPASAITHVTQSEYARLWLQMKGVEAASLGAYLAEADLDVCRAYKARPKRDRIAYSATADSNWMSSLVESTQDMFKWVPVAGLGGDQLVELLGTSKVYADFSEHAGLPLLAMQAAMAGCAVLTGSRGAAANEVDLPIRRKFVVNEASGDAMARIVVLLAQMLADHRSHVSEFSSYRRWIERRESVFADQVSALMGQLDAPKIAVLAGATAG